jgi:hypothetical protein
MFSAAGSEAVLDHLGDKVVHALGRSVTLVREDLDEYRRWKPEWVARHGSRGLANWIHDHLWHHISVELDDVSGVLLYEDGVTREVVAHDRYRIRVKRHDSLGDVSTYPTQAALEFLGQPPAQLPGLEEVHLIAGYQWDRDELKIVCPVLSLRDGKDNILWLVELPESGDARPEPVTLPPADAPSGPQIDVVRADRQRDTDAGDDGPR